MTTVTFFKEVGSKVYSGFRASGHAGYAEYGSDIVCAAISALTESTAMGLTEVVGAKTRITTDEDKGLLEAILEDGQSEEIMEKAQILLITLKKALTAIAEDRQFPGTIRIITKERRQNHV